MYENDFEDDENFVHDQRSIEDEEEEQVPGMVMDFLLRLKNSLEQSNLPELQLLYDEIFPDLTAQYYEKRPWPSIKLATDLVRGTYSFGILYGELHYRHIYAKLQPTRAVRCDSYFNYCHLFNFIVSAQHPIGLQLPHKWMWDIIDEFIYQFQNCSLLRMRTGKNAPKPDEMQELDRIWNVHSVLNVLHSLIDKSNIIEQLKVVNAGGDPHEAGGEFGNHPLYRMLGYYSVIGLLRLHSLLGDYHRAIRGLENVDLNRQMMRNLSFVKALACQTTTYYYVSFAYMMMRRYSDAIRTCTNLLVYLQRAKPPTSSHHKTFQQELVEKQTDQMYVLLALCLALHPQRIDESVSTQMQEKFGEMYGKLQRGDIAEFETQFKFICPKFVSAAPATFDNDGNYIESAVPKHEPVKQQLKIFLEEVTQQLPLLVIRSYLKLYKTMSIEKLANFLEVDQEKLEESLLCFKHKKQSMVCQKDSPTALDGELMSGSDVDFYIDRDMIHIADTKVARRYGDYFMRQIHKFEELYKVVKNIKV